MPKAVISASRRTDIPAFYMPWFMASIEAGRFEVQNPYNRQTVHVPADLGQVHSIVFWSKNFGPFLDQGYAADLVRRGYLLFFNFTINSEHPVLEPMLPPLKMRLAQLTRLADLFGPACIQWRFDPICTFRDRTGRLHDNLDQFEIIAGHAARLGLTSCITSFVDLYRKVMKRAEKSTELEFIDLPAHRKSAFIIRLADHLASLGMRLQLCCEKDLLDHLPAGVDIQASSCIDSEKLRQLYGPDISMAKDSGQRRASGCNCGVSRDIGSYNLHPCRHNCLFCYANPACDSR